jgi:hypothetical protein
MDLSFCGEGSSQQESENWGIATISANLSRRIAHNALRGRRTVSVCTALKCAKRGRFAYFALKLALMGTATGLHRSINQKAVASGNCQCQMKQEATLIRARLKTPRAAAIASILFSVRARSHPSDHQAIPKLRVVPAAAPHIPLRKVPPGICAMPSGVPVPHQASSSGSIRTIFSIWSALQSTRCRWTHTPEFCQA